MMGDFGVGTVDASAIYYAVRGAGGWAWESNAKARSRGEKRVLKQFPDDPHTKWEDWKKRPDVFE
jgi:hypothetical protein